jgi:hypothetical protein
MHLAKLEGSCSISIEGLDPSFVKMLHHCIEILHGNEWCHAFAAPVVFKQVGPVIITNGQGCPCNLTNVSVAVRVCANTFTLHSRERLGQGPEANDILQYS